MKILDDNQLKTVKARITRLENALNTFNPNDWDSQIIAESVKSGWETELKSLRQDVDNYRQAK